MAPERASKGYAADIARAAPAALHDLRGPEEAVARALAALGVPLPTRPNASTAAAGLFCCRVAPQRWLLFSTSAHDVGAALASLAASPSALALDVTDGYATFALAGADAAEILAQATPLDVHPSAFPPDGATFTEFFGQTALVARRDGGFVVLVDASYADYVERFLLAARG